MKTWLITGCSTGFGRALAETVLDAGHRVVVTARDHSAVEDIVARNPENALPLSLDVTVQEQVTRVVKESEARFGGIDVLVNNAGYGYRAAIEEGDVADVDQLFATNFFGAVAMAKEVLPGMRARRSGTIVNMSSVAARLNRAGSGYYSAVKSAVESVSGAMHEELQPLGINVITVAPGGFRTDYAGRSLAQSAIVIDDYADTAGKRRKERQSRHGTQPGDPVKAAQAIVTAVESPSPPHWLVLGQDAYTSISRQLSADLEHLETWKNVTVSTDYAE